MTSVPLPLAAPNFTPTMEAASVRDVGGPATETVPGGDPRIRVAIVIPARNESATIGRLLRAIPPDTSQVRFRTYVCDDGSSDDTAAVAERHGATVLRHVGNIGIGAALTTGFEAARDWDPDIYLQIDADGQHDPRLIPDLIGPILRGEADYVIGSRFLDNGSGLAPVRRAGVRFYTRLVRALGRLRVTDVTSGFRAVRADKYGLISIRSRKNWAIEMTLRAGLNRLRTVEISAPYLPRRAGQSQFDVRLLFVLYHYRAILQIFRAYTARGSVAPRRLGGREVAHRPPRGPTTARTGSSGSSLPTPAEAKSRVRAGAGNQLSRTSSHARVSEDLTVDSRT